MYPWPGGSASRFEAGDGTKVMSVKQKLVTLATGKLMTWYFQTNGLLKPLEKKSDLFVELRRCDLCSGFWVFLLLVTFNPGARLWGIFAPLDILASAMTYAYTARILSSGWMSEHGTTMLDWGVETGITQGGALTTNPG